MSIKEYKMSKVREQMAGDSSVYDSGSVLMGRDSLIAEKSEVSNMMLPSC